MIPRPAVLPSELLRKGWTQFAWARDADGRPAIASDDEEPVSFCLYGSFCYACPKKDVLVWKSACETQTKMNFIAWNDMSGRTQSEVVAVAEAAERKLGWRTDTAKT